MATTSATSKETLTQIFRTAAEAGIADAKTGTRRLRARSMGARPGIEEGGRAKEADAKREAHSSKLNNNEKKEKKGKKPKKGGEVEETGSETDDDKERVTPGKKKAGVTVRVTDSDEEEDIGSKAKSKRLAKREKELAMERELIERELEIEELREKFRKMKSQADAGGREEKRVKRQVGKFRPKDEVSDSESESERETTTGIVEKKAKVEYKKVKANTTGIMAVLEKSSSFEEGPYENPKVILEGWQDARNEAMSIYECEEPLLDSLTKLVLKTKMKAGSGAADWFNEFNKNNSTFKWKTFSSAFKKKFLSPSKILQWETKLDNRRQKSDESPEAFSRELVRLGEIIGRSRSSLLTKFINGLHEELKLKAREWELNDFDSAVTKIQAIWESHNEVNGGEMKARYAKPSGKGFKSDSNKKIDRNTCWNCGGVGHKSSECPSKKQDDKKQNGQSRPRFGGPSTAKQSQNKQSFCFVCGDKDHLAFNCSKRAKAPGSAGTTKAKKTLTSIMEEDSSEEKEVVEIIKTKVANIDRLYYTEVDVGGQQRTLTVDPGASRTLLSPKCIQGTDYEKTEKKVMVDGFNGARSEGVVVRMEIGLGAHSIKVEPVITEELTGTYGLLGLDVLEGLGCSIYLDEKCIQNRYGSTIPIRKMAELDRDVAYLVKTTEVPGEAREAVVRLETKLDGLKEREHAIPRRQLSDEHEEAAEKVTKDMIRWGIVEESANRLKIDFKIGDKVWLKDHYHKTFGAKRIGPFEITKKLSDLSYEIAKTEDGPSLERRHNVVNARDLKNFETRSKEEVVKNILEHRGIKKFIDNMKFKTEWQDGSVTWAPFNHFMDLSKNGEIIYNQALWRYAKSNSIPLPKRWEKKGDVVMWS